MIAELDDLRATIALGCRVLAATGTTTALLGHISVRLDDGRVLVRCRGPHERGLLFTETADIRVVGLDDSGDVGEGFRLPNEFPIHAEVLRARPEVCSVVHAHPRSAVVANLAGLALRPVFGAFDIPAFRLAAEGVPVHPHSGLVRSARSGRAVATTLGSAPACLLRGHGIVTVGDGAVQAVVRALAVEELARVTLLVAQAGGSPDEVPPVDREDLPDLGAAFNEQARWRHEVALLEHRGLAGVAAGLD